MGHGGQADTLRDDAFPVKAHSTNKLIRRPPAKKIHLIPDEEWVALIASILPQHHFALGLSRRERSAMVDNIDRTWILLLYPTTYVAGGEVSCPSSLVLGLVRMDAGHGINSLDCQSPFLELNDGTFFNCSYSEVVSKSVSSHIHKISLSFQGVRTYSKRIKEGELGHIMSRRRRK